MNKLWIPLCGLLLLATAQAQQSTSYDPEVDARERARITGERRQVMQHYAQEEADCYQRFAVNDCLREVRKRRRVNLEELRRQEIILNDQRRAALAAEQQQRVDEKAAERAGPQEAEQREAARLANEERLQRAREKQAEQQNRPLTPAAGASGPRAATPKPDDSAAEAARRLELQRIYEERRQQARERQLERDRAQSEKGPSTSRPLPVPP